MQTRDLMRACNKALMDSDYISLVGDYAYEPFANLIKREIESAVRDSLTTKKGQPSAAVARLAALRLADVGLWIEVCVETLSNLAVEYEKTHPIQGRGSKRK